MVGSASFTLEVNGITRKNESVLLILGFLLRSGTERDRDKYFWTLAYKITENTTYFTRHSECPMIKFSLILIRGRKMDRLGNISKRVIF